MKKKLKKLGYILILLGIVVASFTILKERHAFLENSQIIEFLMSKIDYLSQKDEEKSKVTDEIFSLSHLTNYEYRYFLSKNQEEKETDPSMVEKSGEEVVVKEEKGPVVYIYNTHQTEKYSLSNHEAHNIVPTVMTTSYMLREKLAAYNISSVVEEASVSEVLSKNGWNYASSYRVTRLFLDQVKQRYPSLEFYIDIHRDSVNKKISTIEIEGINYARVMFLLGLENKNYEQNLKVIEYLNGQIEKKYPGLSRGIYKKQGKGVNGVYNQDFSPNCILIEFGGGENTTEEIYHTVEVVGEIIAHYLGGNS